MLAEIALSADGRLLFALGHAAEVTLPHGAQAASVNGGLRVAADRGDGSLILQFQEPPEAAMTLERASWLRASWLGPVPDSASLVTPAALLWPRGALAIGAERDWTALDMSLRRAGGEVEIPVPPTGNGAVWLFAGDLHDAMASLAEAMTMGLGWRDSLQAPLSGWMSWDELRFNVHESEVIENARLVAHRLGKGASIILIDDGWERAVGDWQPHESFAHGMNWLVGNIHQLGLRAGVWIAPFLAALKSPLAREHGDWLLRDDTGQPLVELEQPHWGGRVGTLDPTRPEVRDWLRALGARIASWGFDYVKMDFLNHALTGVAADESRPRTQAHREAIRAIQAGLGPKVLTMGCGTPLLAGRGLFHAARIGSDAVTDWTLLRDCAVNAALRAPLHRRWWWNDVDNVVLRPPLALDQARAWATVAALSGSSLFLGDDLRKLDAERWEIARRVWPPVDVSARPLHLSGNVRPAGDGWAARVRRPWGEWWTVAFVNWDREPSTFGIAWDELGLDPGTSCHVWDFWREHSAGEKTQRVDADVGKESCEVYFLTPAKPHPQVIGSTRHVVAGAVGLEDVRWDEERMCLSGRTIQSLPGWPVRVFVSVPDPWRVSGVEGAHAHVAQAPDAQGHVTLTLNADGDWKILFEKGPASVT